MSVVNVEQDAKRLNMSTLKLFLKKIIGNLLLYSDLSHSVTLPLKLKSSLEAEGTTCVFSPLEFCTFVVLVILCLIYPGQFAPSMLFGLVSTHFIFLSTNLIKQCYFALISGQKFKFH